MIELRNVSKYYNNNGHVNLGLRNIDLTMYKNEIIAIIGDSGSGKSTLLNVICGVDTYEDGEMYFKGNETSYFNQNDMDNYRKEHVGFVYQNYNIIDSYTVLENVMLPMILRGENKKSAKKRALELIEKVGLSHRIDNKGTNLSGGEKQRCVIARALAADCDILACDEPTGNLDSKSGEEIIKIIKEVSKDKLVLIVTHNYDEVKDIATRRIKVADGTIVEDHIIEEVCEDDNIVLDNVINEAKKTTLVKIALNNIKSTPRKSLFTLMVFFIVSLVAFYLYLTCMSSSQVSVFNPDVSFNNFEYNRLIAYNYDHSGLVKEDYLDVDGVVYENAFYEDILVGVDLISSESHSYYNLSVCYTAYPNMQYTLIHGEHLSDEDDAFIIFPKERLDKFSLDSTKYVGGKLVVDQMSFDFVGFGSSEYVNSPVLITNKNIANFISGLAYENFVSLSINIPQLNETLEVSRRNQEVSQPTLYIPLKYSDYVDSFEYSFMLNEIYPFLTPEEIEIRYLYSSFQSSFFIMPDNYEYEFADVYEATIYANIPNKAMDDLEENGLTVIRPSVDYSEVSQNQVLFIAYIAITTIIIFVLIFVAQAVLSRIYISKNKDYAVFRSLGVTKNKMGIVVISEIVFISFMATILAFISMYIAYFSIDSSYLNVIFYNNLGISLIYFVMMFIFSLYIARRFNKRLFKFSVSKTFKGEVINND